jgi:hypothetical protein
MTRGSSVMTRMPLILAALLAALLLPSAAQADTEGFAAVLQDGTMDPLHEPGPRRDHGPAARPRPGPRRAPRGPRHAGGVTYGIGSVGRLYAIDPRIAGAAPVGPPFPTGLRGLRASLAVAPDGRSAQILTDVGQRLLVDTRTGAVTELPALRTDTGAATTPVAAVARDGRLTGVDPVARTLVTETDPGSGVMTARPLDTGRTPRVSEPYAFTIATDGRGFLAAGAPDDVDGDGDADRDSDVRQSQLLRLDLPDTRLRPAGDVLPREVVALTTVGRVPEDRRVTGVRVRMPSRVSARQLLSRSRGARIRALGMTIRADEAFQAVISLRVPRRETGPSASPSPTRTARTAGSITPRSAFPVDVEVRGRDRQALQRAVGRRVSAIVGVRDPAGNRVVVNRRFTLTR